MNSREASWNIGMALNLVTGSDFKFWPCHLLALGPGDSPLSLAKLHCPHQEVGTVVPADLIISGKVK